VEAKTTGEFKGASTNRSGRPAVTAKVSSFNPVDCGLSGGCGWLITRPSLTASRREPLHPDKVEDRE
jgi:hypothetical protein